MNQAMNLLRALAIVAQRVDDDDDLRCHWVLENGALEVVTDKHVLSGKDIPMFRHLISKTWIATVMCTKGGFWGPTFRIRGAVEEAESQIMRAMLTYI